MPGPGDLCGCNFFFVFEFVGRKRRHDLRLFSCFWGLLFHYWKEFSDVSCTDDSFRHRVRVGVGTGVILFAARSRKDETQNGRPIRNWTRWLSQVSFQTAANLQRDLNFDHLEFWFHFEFQALFLGTGCIIFSFCYVLMSGWATTPITLPTC